MAGIIAQIGKHYILSVPGFSPHPTLSYHIERTALLDSRFLKHFLTCRLFFANGSSLRDRWSSPSLDVTAINAHGDETSYCMQGQKSVRNANGHAVVELM